MKSRRGRLVSSEVFMGLRWLAGLPSYLRRPLSVAESRAILRRRLERDVQLHEVRAHALLAEAREDFRDVLALNLKHHDVARSARVLHSLGHELVPLPAQLLRDHVQLAFGDAEWQRRHAGRRARGLDLAARFETQRRQCCRRRDRLGDRSRQGRGRARAPTSGPCPSPCGRPHRGGGPRRAADRSLDRR